MSSQYGWRVFSYDFGAPGCRPEENNVSGFAAVPAGYYDGSSFYDAGYNAIFWSATQNASFPGCAYYRSLSYDPGDVPMSTGAKYFGYSVRCLRD